MGHGVTDAECEQQPDGPQHTDAPGASLAEHVPALTVAEHMAHDRASLRQIARPEGQTDDRTGRIVLAVTQLDTQ